MTHNLGHQAIVIGGSITGLSTASALSPYFDKVIMVERDEHPDTYNPRKAIPQGYHGHALLKGGENALNTLFPGLTDDLVACGAQRIDFSEDVRWFHGGVWKKRYASGIKVMVQSRPLLEQVMRERVNRLSNVEFYYGYQVESLKATTDRKMITGVVLQNMEDRTESIEISASLVVDASGRGSKTPQWLEKLGLNSPDETILDIGLSYSSRMYKKPENFDMDSRLMVINPHAPDVLRAGYIFPIENEHILVTMAGYSGDTTPKDNVAFVDYARKLAQPEIYEFIRELEPVNNVKYYGVPKTHRRHYERLADMPSGLLVLGDATCGFDPVFGQGMSVAVMSALALANMLAHETGESLSSLTKRFQKQVATIADVPWMLGSTEDFRYPGTRGDKSVIVPFMHWYSQHVFELSGTDTEVFETFADVMHLLKGAHVLFKPSIVWKVIKHAIAA